MHSKRRILVELSSVNIPGKKVSIAFYFYSFSSVHSNAISLTVVDRCNAVTSLKITQPKIDGDHSKWCLQSDYSYVREPPLPCFAPVRRCNFLVGGFFCFCFLFVFVNSEQPHIVASSGVWCDQKRLAIN